MLAPQSKGLYGTPPAVVDAALRMLLGERREEVDTSPGAHGTEGVRPSRRSSAILADIGCGDGRVLVAAASGYGCKCVGWEIAADRCLASQAAAKDAGVDDLVTIIPGNALEGDLIGSSVTHVFLSLITRGLKLVFPMLQALANARGAPIPVVTSLYRFPGVEPIEREWTTAQGANGVAAKYPIYRYAIAPVDTTVVGGGGIAVAGKHEIGAAEDSKPGCSASAAGGAGPVA